MKIRIPSCSAVCLARENARMVRDQLTLELWEELNRLYLFIRSPQARKVWQRSPSEFFQEIKAGSLHLNGIANATLIHNEGWWFVQTGQFLERGDKTTRILDVRYETLPARGVPKSVSQTEALEWSAVLRSCSAWDAYKSIYGADVQPRSRRGISPAQRQFSALAAILRRRIELRRPADFRRGGGIFSQRCRQIDRTFAGRTAIQHD